MRILLAGFWEWSQYEAAFKTGLEKCGCEVVKFSLSGYFDSKLGRLQKFLPVPLGVTKRINRDLLSYSQKIHPDLVLFWTPQHFFPSTIKSISQAGSATISYVNDDPLNQLAQSVIPWHHQFLWYWYRKCLPFFDYNFFYREVNCIEARALGARHTDVLLPYFLPWQEKPTSLNSNDAKKFGTDVVFAGHFERDGRSEGIKALIHAGIKVKIWGGGYWTADVLKDAYQQVSPITPAIGEEYVKALTGAKVCLCFLSKLNRDTYTRRCFEIPACGKAMLAERTNDLLQFFKEDEEACFFSTKEELVEKAKWLIQDDDARERIALAGMKRVWTDGHDVYSRAKDFLLKLKQ